jgi:hypothetical protein
MDEINSHALMAALTVVTGVLLLMGLIAAGVKL